MKSHEVLKEAFDQSSPKAIASELGVSLSLVYKWAQEQSDTGSGSRNPLDRIVEIHDNTQHQPIIEWLSEQCGGYFVKNPEICTQEEYKVLPATHEIVGQFSHLLERISQAALDNSITPDEAAELLSSALFGKSGVVAIEADCAQAGYGPENVLDGKSKTIWHTRWGAIEPPHPHHLSPHHQQHLRHHQ